MLDERGGVTLGSKFVQKPSRALDVGEEEGDGAGREVGPHRCLKIMKRWRPHVQNRVLGKPRFDRRLRREAFSIQEFHLNPDGIRV